MKRAAVFVLTALAWSAMSRCSVMAQKPAGLSVERAAAHLAALDQARIAETPKGTRQRAGAVNICVGPSSYRE